MGLMWKVDRKQKDCAKSGGVSTDRFLMMQQRSACLPEGQRQPAVRRPAVCTSWVGH